MENQALWDEINAMAPDEVVAGLAKYNISQNDVNTAQASLHMLLAASVIKTAAEVYCDDKINDVPSCKNVSNLSYRQDTDQYISFRQKIAEAVHSCPNVDGRIYGKFQFNAATGKLVEKKIDQYLINSNTAHPVPTAVFTAKREYSGKKGKPSKEAKTFGVKVGHDMKHSFPIDMTTHGGILLKQKNKHAD
jgi:uncharacterized protein YydD (DUF2326 family)